MKRILILENAPFTKPERWDGESISDRAVESSAANVAQALSSRGWKVERTQIGLDPKKAIEAIEIWRPNVVFQLCESLAGNSRLEPALPYLLEWLNVPFTGNSADIIALLLDKIRTKRILSGLGLPTPEFLALNVENAENTLANWNHWPAIMKPATEDASVGIDRGSVVENIAQARTRFWLLAERFQTPILIERFIEGRELNVALLETPEGLKLGINEIDFSAFPPDHPRILTHEAKWNEDSPIFRLSPSVPAIGLEPEIDRELRRLAISAWNELGLRGYARVDFRVDSANRPWILEINPNPDLSKDAGFAKSLPQMGLSYEEAIEQIVLIAQQKTKSKGSNNVMNSSQSQSEPQPEYQHTYQVSQPNLSSQSSYSSNFTNLSPITTSYKSMKSNAIEGIAIRSLQASDREPIEKMLRQTGFFSEEEVRVALELVDEALSKPKQQDYFFGVAEIERKVAGYVCYGRCDLTLHTWDLYWVCVNPEYQNKGIGRQLMSWAEKQMLKEGCRLIIVETSGRPQYEPTRSFYLHIGYQEEARIKDFYNDGDDLVIYTKHFPIRQKQ